MRPAAARDAPPSPVSTAIPPPRSARDAPPHAVDYGHGARAHRVACVALVRAFARAHTRRMQLPPRLEALVLKTGLHLGTLPDEDRALVLALAACALEPQQRLREDEVNRRLLGWLADTGTMLQTDHVDLRRWLVDAGYVARDSWGRAYLRGPAELMRARGALGTTDGPALAAAVRAARVAAQHARVARRRAWEDGRPS